MAELRHLLVVIPGIGGSVLADPAGRAEWQVSATVILKRIFRPASLHIDRPLIATGLTKTLVALGSLVTISGYDRATANLRAQFDDVVVRTYHGDGVINSRANVLAYPYDFRQSVAQAAEGLDRAVESIRLPRSTSQLHRATWGRRCRVLRRQHPLHRPSEPDIRCCAGDRVRV
jgi:hypothetical protein